MDDNVRQLRPQASPEAIDDEILQLALRLHSCGAAYPTIAERLLSTGAALLMQGNPGAAMTALKAAEISIAGARRMLEGAGTPSRVA